MSRPFNKVLWAIGVVTMAVAATLLMPKKASAAWGGWESLGGIIMEEPNCTSWGADRIDCFARGTDSAMYHRWWDGNAWGGWESLGGIIMDAPDCVSWGPNRIDCFARGTDQAMYHRWWDGNAWGGWESLGGTLLSKPACTSWSANRLDCFARGTDSAMYHRWWDGAAWGGWENLGGTILGQPQCVSWGASRLDCFARGTDSAMYHRWWDGAAWNGWENLGGIILEQPECVSWSANRLDCFARGMDHAMYHRWWDGNAWGGWESLGGIILEQPSCTSWGPDRIDCFARGTDSAMYHRWWSCPECVVGQRKSINNLTASELLSLRRGVAQMMAWNTAPRDSAEFRRSWLYWANMHAHFGPSCAGPINGTGMTGVQTFTASNPNETATWCKCEHGSPQFLTWHRMYLWYFERVLQAAAGDSSLRLPFWDYANDPNLPAAYRDLTYVNEAGQTVPNPLRVQARQSSLNAGTAGLTPGVRSATGAMSATSFGAFSSTLEGTPHGAVHCAVASAGCPNGLMGAVPAAALDPIFYAHHTNIDRLYECWLRVDEGARLPSNPTDLNEQFTFVDADGSTPQRRVTDMLRTSQLGYSYTDGGDCPAMVNVASAEGETSVTAAAASTPLGEQSFALAGQTHLERGVTTVPLDVPEMAREPLSAAATAPGERRAYVVIEGLTADQGPGALYNVYLKGDGDRREQIGVLSFFNMTAVGGAHAGHGGSLAPQQFDVTDTLRELGIGTARQPVLIFEPTTGVTDSSPQAAAALISPEANVRFDSARIVFAP